MPNFGPLELFILLLIIIVLFGVGRISNIGGELGRAISNFRRGLNADTDADTDAGAKKPDANA